MNFVLLIYLAIGTTHAEHFQTWDQCTKRLAPLVELYRQTYAVRAFGCFPRELIAEAGKG